MEVNYYARPYGIALYAVGPDIEGLPNEGKVFSRGEGFAQLWYERLGGFSNLQEAAAWCGENNLPTPVSSCIPGM